MCALGAASNHEGEMGEFGRDLAVSAFSDFISQVCALSRFVIENRNKNRPEGISEPQTY